MSTTDTAARFTTLPDEHALELPGRIRVVLVRQAAGF
jgi:hypothetical protein